MDKKYILRHPDGDVYNPIGGYDFPDFCGFLNIGEVFNREEAEKQAQALKEKHKLPYIIIQEVL